MTFLFAALCCAKLQAADFAMFKADPGRSGRLALRLKLPISLAWKADSDGEFYSSPAIANGSVFLGNSDHHVYSYNLADGKLNWKTELGERIYGSSPSLDNGSVYINCVDGCAYGLNAGSGAQELKYCLKQGGFFGSSSDILGSPLVENGRLYFGSDNHEVHALVLPEGKLLWKAELGGKVHDTAPAHMGSLLYLAAGDGRVYALDAKSGALKWKSQAYDLLNTTVAALGAKLYFGSRDQRMHCLDAATGKQIWSYACQGGILSSPALDQDSDLLVFGSADHSVYGLSMANGRLKWRFETGGVVLASPLITGSTVWIGSFDGIFYALDLGSGKEIWRMDLGKKIFSSAAAAGDKVAVGCLNGLIYCFKAGLESR